MFFSKMHAAGNDYVYIRDQDYETERLAYLSRIFSDRRKGIGGDGLICVKKLDENAIRMRIFNSDGSEGATCGNGMRCAALFAAKYLGSGRNELTVKAKAGDYPVRLFFDGKEVIAEADFDEPHEIFGGEKLFKALSPFIKIDKNKMFAVNAGNDHLVAVGGEFNAEIYAKAAFRSGLFAGGVNAEVISFCGNDIKVSVFERGSGYTLSCGSGAVASAFALKKITGRTEFTLKMPGGDLSVKFSDKIATLKGEINEVFTGNIDYEIQ